MTSPDCPDALDGVLAEIQGACLLMRTRLISRVITATYDEVLQPFGIGAAQFVLLVVIGRLAPASRAEIGRNQRQDRSTLSRNLKIMMARGWVEEDGTGVKGRRRPLVLTQAGKTLVIEATPAWRMALEQVRKLLGSSGTTAVVEIAHSMTKEVDRSTALQDVF